jgi:hypothetical protein
VQHPVDDDILQQVLRLLHEFGIQTHVPRLGVAAPPPGLHALAVVGRLELPVHHREVEVELPGVPGFEVRGLELHHHRMALQARVVEQQVDEKLVALHLDADLTAQEGEALA